MAVFNERLENDPAIRWFAALDAPGAARTSDPGFHRRAFEACGPVLCRLAAEIGLAEQGPGPSLLARSIQAATVAARCLFDEIPVSSLRSLAVALFVWECATKADEPVRVAYPEPVLSAAELDAVEEYTQTSDWWPIADQGLRTGIQEKLCRLALDRMKLADALVLRVRTLADNDLEQTARLLGVDPRQAERWVNDATRRFGLTLLAVAEELLVRHGRQPPLRFTVSEAETT